MNFTYFGIKDDLWADVFTDLSDGCDDIGLFLQHEWCNGEGDELGQGFKALGHFGMLHMERFANG